MIKNGTPLFLLFIVAIASITMCLCGSNPFHKSRQPAS